jgi:hypothetical protein
MIQLELPLDKSEKLVGAELAALVTIVHRMNQDPGKPGSRGES